MSTPACGGIRESLSAYLEGELDPRAAAEVRSHLEGCPSCRSELELLRLTVGALRSLPDLPPPAGILAGVRARLRPEPWHRRLLSGRQWLLGVPVGAVATLLVVIGVALFQARYPGIERAVTPAVPEHRRVEPPGVPAPPALPPAQPLPPPATRMTPAAPAIPAIPAIPAGPKGAPAPIPALKAVQQPEASPKRPTAAPPARPDSIAGTDLEIPRSPVPAAAPEAPRVTVSQPSPPAEQLGRWEQSAPPSPSVMPAPESRPEAADITAATGPPSAPEAPPSRRTAALDALEEQPPAASPQRDRPRVAPTGASPGAEAWTAPRRALPLSVQKRADKGAGTGFATVGAPQDAATSMAPGTIALPSRQERSTLAPGTPAPVVAARRESAAAPPISAVCLLAPDGGTIGEFSGLLKRLDAKDVWIRALEQREVREAFLPYRERLALLPEPEHGWSVTFRIPPHRVAGLFDALAKRPGLRLLSEPAGLRTGDRTAESQALRITVLR